LPHAMLDLTLPMDAQLLVPHRRPLCFVDRLIEFSDGSGVVESLIREDNPLVDEGGRADPVIAVELMAQAYAAVKGYHDMRSGSPVKKGFLAAVRDFVVAGPICSGDTLFVTVRTVTTLGAFPVANAYVSRQGSRIASANLKLWIPGEASRG
jgi:3-hydroxyacyl-[acyl-carrier-protein] dehydratase